jgi:hypothetical protein
MLLTVLAVIALGVGGLQSQAETHTIASRSVDRPSVVQVQPAPAPQRNPFLGS